MKLMLCLSLSIFLSVQSGANPDVLEKLDSEIYGTIPIAEIDRYIPGDEGKYCLWVGRAPICNAKCPSSDDWWIWKEVKTDKRGDGKKCTISGTKRYCCRTMHPSFDYKELKG